MKKIIITGFLCSLLSQVACAAFDFLIEPGQRVGEISPSSSEKDLIKIYGSSNVTRSDVYIGEGASVPGTTLFGSDAEKTVQIIWQSTVTMSGPQSIFIQGKRWRTRNGLGLNSSLEEIEKLNGGPFELFGFGWDYSGTIASCLGGDLKFLGTSGPTGLQGRTLIVRLDYPDNEGWEEQPGSEYLPQVTGDRVFRSDHPAMRKLNPTVYQIVVIFE